MVDILDWCKRIALCAALVSVPHAVMATQVQHAPGGLQYLAGGITEAETAFMDSTRHRYALALTATSQISGGPLVDAHVQITDATGTVLLDTDMDGPWLFAALQPGHYQLAVRFQDETHRRKIEIVPQDQLEVRFSFRSDPSVSLRRPP